MSGEKKNQKWFKAYHATKYLWTLYLKTFCCMKFSNLQNIHFNFVWFLREKKLKIDFNTIVIFNFFQMLSAIILIFFNRTCAKIDKFSQNGSIFFLSGHNTTKRMWKSIKYSNSEFWKDETSDHIFKILTQWTCIWFLPMKWSSNIQTISYP